MTPGCEVVRLEAGAGVWLWCWSRRLEAAPPGPGPASPSPRLGAGAGHWQCILHSNCQPMLFLIFSSLYFTIVTQNCNHQKSDKNFYRHIFHMTYSQCTFFCTECLWGAVQWISNQIPSLPPGAGPDPTLGWWEEGNIKHKMDSELHIHLRDAVFTFTT